MSDESRRVEEVQNLLSMGEAARQLGISYETLYHACRNGQVRYVKTPGGRRRIPKSEIERFMTPTDIIDPVAA